MQESDVTYLGEISTVSISPNYFPYINSIGTGGMITFM